MIVQFLEPRSLELWYTTNKHNKESSTPSADISTQVAYFCCGILVYLSWGSATNIYDGLLRFSEYYASKIADQQLLIANFAYPQLLRKAAHWAFEARCCLSYSRKGWNSSFCLALAHPLGNFLELLVACCSLSTTQHQDPHKMVMPKTTRCWLEQSDAHSIMLTPQAISEQTEHHRWCDALWI